MAVSDDMPNVQQFTASGSVTSFNMVAVISQGTASATFAYDDAHQRIKQTLVAGSTTTVTTYLNDPASGAMEDKAVTGSTGPSLALRAFVARNAPLERFVSYR